MSSPAIAYEENTYQFVETSPEWKTLCRGLPCFPEVEWPNYPTAVIEDEINGKPVVIQLWKGWCQQFLNRDDFPGGIGGEVGVYERVLDRQFPKQRPDFFPESTWSFLLGASKFADNRFWWPMDESYEIEFEFVNPITGEAMFHAGPQKTYWRNKWMDIDSYKKYSVSQGKRWSWLPSWFPKNSRTPVFAGDYLIEYKINGKTYPRW